MESELLARYDRRVPRYTSYPTALQFHEGVGADAYAAWLGHIPVGASASLYVHIPYCHSMCWYCGCNTKIVARYAPVQDYLDRVIAEANLVARRLPERLRASHIHWGGGSPNILSPDGIRRLADEFRRRFDVARDAEFAVEIDPRLMDAGKAAALAEAGVTRASVGAQDFDPAVQEAVNRVQPFDMVAASVAALRHRGIRAINLDLMYGLPGQTEEGVYRNVDMALSLAPDRVALFGYAHVPWMKKHQRLIDATALPDTPARWRMAEAAGEALEAAGYVRVGLDHFARADDPLARAATAGEMQRNFQGYTTDDSEILLGFGPSAIGAMPEGYVQNAPEVRRWAEAVDAGRLPVVRGVEAGPEDRLRRDVIHRLMCDLSVDLDDMARRYGRASDHFAAERAALRPFAEDGLVILDGERVTVTPLGRPLMRTVAAVFDAYLKAGAERHAKAV